jgi:two-component system sensor histidine kinase AlgZ
MQINPPSSRPEAVMVLPDWCHTSVIARSLLALNLALLVALVAPAANWKSGLSDFVESAMLLEWASLLSLAGLCGVKRLLSWRNVPVPAWQQRALCALTPMAISGGLTRLLLSQDWFVASFPRLNLWHVVAMAALAGIVLQHYFELRMRAFSPALSEARLQALQARIRPHFLFNSLNAVLSLIRSEPLRAETTLEDLADLFRVLMRDSRNLTSLGDELRLCRQYLSIEKVRLGERLQVKWHLNNITDVLLRRAQVPVLLLQPLLENAVYYGVEASGAASMINITLTRSLDRIEIIVTNPVHANTGSASGGQAGGKSDGKSDGKGTGKSGGNHMALINIQERLTLLYDVEAQLSFGEEQGEYRVKLRFPYVKLAESENKT